MEIKVNDSCNGSRGCRVYILPTDRRVKPFYSKVYGKRYDFFQSTFIFNLLVDKMVEKRK